MELHQFVELDIATTDFMKYSKFSLYSGSGKLQIFTTDNQILLDWKCEDIKTTMSD